MEIHANLPVSNLPRVVIIGGGFAGLETAKKLVGDNFQVVILDKNNYHQFQPLFYQVATAGLEPSSISFPLRKLFQKDKNINIRVCEVESIDINNKKVHTSIGHIDYQYLILAMGADTNYFGMTQVAEKSLSMKSVSDALLLRNTILQNYENALVSTNASDRKALLHVVVAGGGPTGVEVCGALAEMNKYVLPKDIPELDFNEMQITLVEGSPNLLGAMSESSRDISRKYLEDMGVKVLTEQTVSDYDGEKVILKSGDVLHSRTLIWAAGVSSKRLDGIPENCYGRANRLKVNQYNQLEGVQDVFAIGDQSYTEADSKFPNGHPQVAQVAMQMGKTLAKNLLSNATISQWKPFIYNDLGSMATIGRNKAVAELPGIKLKGFIAWIVWMFIHLISLIGAKNRVMVFINWVVSYISYDQSLRLIIRSKTPAPASQTNTFSK
jgi:NADH:ubiquinone reductase (H+-translocating)